MEMFNKYREGIKHRPSREQYDLYDRLRSVFWAAIEKHMNSAKGNGAIPFYVTIKREVEAHKKK
jgi:hypothetical protein